MPRRRTNTQDPPRKRSRNSCDKCRLKKIKCDETKPSCGQCQAKGFRCQTSVVLKWETDYQTSGRAFGRAGVWSKHAHAFATDNCLSTPSPGSDTTDGQSAWCRVPHILPYSFVNATVDNGTELTTVQHYADRRPTTTHIVLGTAHTEHEDTASTASLSPWLARLQLSGRYHAIPSALQPISGLQNPMHSHLLSYYMERLCPMTVPSLVSKSPFASLVLPYSISSSPTVLDSLLALAACHRSKSDESFKPTALKLGDKVLRTLRSRLCQEDAFHVAMETESLVVMMILCQIEIMNECDKRWIVHLKGARDLIRIRRQAVADRKVILPSNDLVNFAERYFAYQDVIGRTACGVAPIFGSDFWTAQGNETDAWLGCSSGLVAIICNITELSRQHSNDPTVSFDAGFQSQAAALKKRLTVLEQRVFGEEDDLLQTAAELKRISAEVYLHCSIYGASPSASMIKERVQHILRLIFVLLKHQVTAGLSWPVFVAAVELDPLEDLEWTPEDEYADGIPRHARPFILFALDRMSASIANISRTRSVIEKIWHAREFDDALEHDAESRLNDWERFVAPFCGNMSLV